MIAAIAGATLVLGLLVVLRGAFPQKQNLADRLGEFSEVDMHVSRSIDDSLSLQLAKTLLETVKGDDIFNLRSDLEVTDTSFDDFAIEKARAGLAAGVCMALVAKLAGVISGGMPLLIVGLLAASVGYMAPDFELKKKAKARRLEFSRALTSFITLIGSSISGGGGVSTAMRDAVAMGNGWVFDKLRNALDEAALNGTSSWHALDALGCKLQVTALIELAGSLTLAGNSGARVTETLHSRAESSRAKELAEMRSEAEAKSSTLGLPVGIMLIGWVIFLGYPAVAALAGV